MTSYYGQPVLNQPTWEARDIAGYFFLGGLAGASAAVGLGAELTGRPALAKVAKTGSAAAGSLSLAALIHDLGRPARFLNMLRVLKPTSPMSVGTWILAPFVPTTIAAAASAVTGRYLRLGSLASVAGAILGLPVATYTAVLMANTAVPAWHEGYELYPFIFVSSAAASAAGLGILGAPVAESGPLVPLAALAGAAEVGLSSLHKKRIGMVKEAFEEGKARTFSRAADVLLAGGAVVAATSGRSRLRRAVGGAMLLAGSAYTRFAIFEAGLRSAADPKYTVQPQRERLEAAKR